MIKVSKREFSHKGGTKFYRLYTFLNEEVDTKLLVRVWGPNSVAHKIVGGRGKVEEYGLSQSMLRDFDYAIVCRIDNGYQVVESESYDKEIVGSYFAKFLACEFHASDAVKREVYEKLMRTDTSELDKILSAVAKKKESIETPKSEPVRYETWGSW